MSDDFDGAHSHQHILHNGESYIKLADAAEAFKRLRAWRTAVYNALVEWHDPPRDGENPKDALRRLIQYEITAALDPAVSQAAADLVATARREGMKEAAQIVKEIWEKFVKSLPNDVCLNVTLDGEKIAPDGVDIPTGLTYEAAIRAAANEKKP